MAKAVADPKVKAVLIQRSKGYSHPGLPVRGRDR